MTAWSYLEVMKLMRKQMFLNMHLRSHIKVLELEIETLSNDTVLATSEATSHLDLWFKIPFSTKRSQAPGKIADSKAKVGKV